MQLKQNQRYHPQHQAHSSHNSERCHLPIDSRVINFAIVAFAEIMMGLTPEIPSSLGVVKLVIAITILFAGLISVVAPLRLAGAANPKLLILGNMMASGVLLAAALVHQLADSAECLGGSRFPWATFIAGSTFVAFLVVETSIHLFISGGSYSLDYLLHAHDARNDESEAPQKACKLDEEEGKPLVVPSSDVEMTSIDRSNSSSSVSVEKPPITSLQIDGASCSHDCGNRSDHGSVVASLLLMLALSTHSVIAGVAMGIEGRVESVSSTATAILCHKSFEGFALGSSLVVASCERRLHCALGAIFSCATPVGILLGAAMRPKQSSWGSEENEDGTAVAVVQAVVAGTFLYISIMEIGVKELLICRDNHTSTLSMAEKQLELAKVLVFVAGFMAMSVLALFV